MLVVFFKSVIIFFVIFLVIRLMGKREIGELQPFELVITLIIAEVACIPMNDPYIPLYTGIVPIVTLAFLEILFSAISKKSLFIRKCVSGTSIMIIDKKGINYKNLSKLNMNINDLIGSLRNNGVCDVLDVAYAVVETSGKISVIKKPTSSQENEVFFPLSLMVNGKWEEENIALAGVEKVNILQFFKDNGIEKEKDVAYCDIRQNGVIFVSSLKGGDYSGNIALLGGKNW